MSETNQKNTGVSAVAKAKQRNMLKKQRIAVIFIAAALVLLAVALAVVAYVVDIYVFEDVDGTEYYVKRVDGKYALCHKSGEVCDISEDSGKTYYQTVLGTLVSVDSEKGSTSIYATVHTEGSEVRDYGEYVLLYKRMTYDKNSTKDQSRVIASIEVHNSNGTYTFLRNEKGDFVILGNEDAPYSRESFAQLAVACGYTLSTRRLEDPVKLPDGSVDYAEYGLASEIRERVETDKDGNEITVEYEYVPTWFEITAMNGESHKVTVGDATVTGTGYYARYEGRDTVYVIGTNGISELLMGRIESFITPMIVYPMELTNYFNVADFRIFDNIDYNAIYSALAEKFGEGDTSSEEFLKEYERLFALHSHKVCDFYYSELEERQGSMYAYVPYISNLEYAGGYYLNSDNVDIMLEGFYQTEFGEVIKLAPSAEELEEYGLADAPYVVGFLFKTTNEKGERVYVENFVDISYKTDDGVFYAYSSVYDMIVSVSEASFAFLEWDETYWFDDSFVQHSISNIDSIMIESPAFRTEFEIEDSASKYLSYVAQKGNKITVGETEYKIVKDTESGKYVLVAGEKRVNPLYSGDYLITPTVYTTMEPQAENYIFSESQQVDMNGDGTNDGVIYYFYDVISNGKEYGLVAQVMYADLKGNPLTDTKLVQGEKAYSSSFFMTQNGYLYFEDKYSATGMYLENTYGQYNRGGWADGSVYVTSDGKYVLVGSDTGAWCIVNDLSSGLYLADSEKSMLAKRAVEIPEIKSADGKIKRYSDVYYPLTDKKIAYDDEKDMIVSYNKVKREWEKISYSDCTIGVWNTGDYYVLEGGVLVMVDSRTGDWGRVSVLQNPIYVANIMSDGKLLDYTVDRNGYSEASKTANAMQNFQELYKYLLTGSFEGLADLTEEEKSAYRAEDDFLTGGDDGECILKITTKATDFKGNRRDTVYRFYRYSERQVYVTVELIGESGESSSEKGYGNFCVLYTFVQKVIVDAEKVVNGVTVDSTQKY